MSIGEITRKQDCCGCMACVQACPKQCISIKEDEEGFLFPIININVCVKCEICHKVCPTQQNTRSLTPSTVYAATNTDEYIRKQSSSGGIFSLLAEKIVKQGGVVFGAAFNENWEVVHNHTETLDGIAKFRGSKYVQSRIGSSYTDAEHFLKAGRKVLFSGTPCQISGLKGYLRKDYENLLTIDCVCHGVPSPKIFRDYIYEESNGKRIHGINFRDKKSGWKNYSVTLSFDEKGSLAASQNHNDNRYIQGFLSNLFLRPSCYNCHFRAGYSNSDITLGDFWGIDKIRPDLDDDKGLNIVITNNKPTDALLSTIGCKLVPMRLEDAIKYNPSITTSVCIPEYRQLFFSVENFFGLNFAIKLCCNNSSHYRILRRICLLLMNKRIDNRKRLSP